MPMLLMGRIVVVRASYGSHVLGKGGIGHSEGESWQGEQYLFRRQLAEFLKALR